jgi:hypothetical protein
MQKIRTASPYSAGMAAIQSASTCKSTSREFDEGPVSISVGLTSSASSGSESVGASGEEAAGGFRGLAPILPPDGG